MPEYSREAIRAFAGQPVVVTAICFAEPKTRIGYLVGEDNQEGYNWFYFILESPSRELTPVDQVSTHNNIELISSAPRQPAFSYETALTFLSFDSCIGVDHRIIYSDKQVKLNTQYPHICPKCNAPAYIGINQVDCSKCGG